jgi:DNA polymerase zeta
MIAYNYCYSTCLGRIREFKGKSQLGFMEVKPPPGLLGALKDHIHSKPPPIITFGHPKLLTLDLVAPNGIVYAKTSARKSLLAKMLEELLETRVMVKQAMKTAKDNKVFLPSVIEIEFVAEIYSCAGFDETA